MCYTGKIHIFEIFSKRYGPIIIKLVMINPCEKGINSCTNWGLGPLGEQKLVKLGKTYKIFLSEATMPRASSLAKLDTN